MKRKHEKNNNYIFKNENERDMFFDIGKNDEF